MSMIRALILALLPLADACTPKYVDMEPHVIPKTPLKGAIAEFRLISYDGNDLKGRLLLGATIDTLVIDGRLFEYSEVELRKLQACDTKKPLTFYEFDFYRPPMKPGDLVTIRPHYWYGADLDFHLFDRQLMPDFPECFEADLMVWVLDGRIAATLPIRVTRTDKPSAPPKTPSDAPPNKDTSPELGK